MDKKPCLVYFDMPGRAYLIRNIFHAAHMEYDDKRVSFEEHKKLKADKNSMLYTPFGTGSLPMLTHGDVTLV